jgi:hypothetical protein
MTRTMTLSPCLFKLIVGTILLLWIDPAAASFSIDLKPGTIECFTIQTPIDNHATLRYVITLRLYGVQYSSLLLSSGYLGFSLRPSHPLSLSFYLFFFFFATNEMITTLLCFKLKLKQIESLSIKCIILYAQWKLRYFE